MSIKPKTIAQAVFQMLKDQPISHVNEALAGMEAFAHLYQSESTLRDSLNNPRISLERKKQLILFVFKAASIPESFLSFFILLIKNKALRLLPLILRHLFELRNEHFNILTVEVTSFSPLKQEEEDKLSTELKKIFNSKTFEFIHKTDPQILGGVVLRLQDQVLDSSLKGKLKNIQHSLHS